MAVRTAERTVGRCVVVCTVASAADTAAQLHTVGIAGGDTAEPVVAAVAVTGPGIAAVAAEPQRLMDNHWL